MLWKSVVQVGAAQAVVVEEPLVLPSGAGADVGGKPTTDADVDMSANEAGWCGGEHTPSDTLEECYWMGLP
jgi:hypothetical protein